MDERGRPTVTPAARMNERPSSGSGTRPADVDVALWAQLLPLLDDALQRPHAERDAWVQSLQVPTAVKAGLQRLLVDRAAMEAQGFLEDPLPALEAAPVWQPGHHIGPYRLLRELGHGGMSVVWLAERDDGALRRQVALKIPHAGPGQMALAARLQRERDILAGLEHRHIARLYDVGTTADGVPFLVLEHVQGETLVAHCDARRLGVPERLQLFMQVLRAVQHAHGMLVLHRDIKPSNILVDPAGEAKLLDFGIAKLLGGENAELSVLTRQNGRVMTPAYAAPEQIAGGPVGTASDVYALGVVLFELLTGARPYQLPRASAAALEEAILASEPRRPSDACRGTDRHERLGTTAPKLQRALRGDLDAVVRHALQKSPEHRYATAEAFEQDLRRHLGREPVLAQPGRRWYRLRKFVARNALAVGAGGLVVLTLGAGLGVATWQARQTRLEAAKATAVKNFLVGLFESNSLEQTDALQKRRQTVQELLEDSARSLQGGFAGQPEIRDEMQAVVGGLLHELGLSGAAVELRRQRVDQQGARGVGLAPRVTALQELADSLSQQGDAGGAAHALQRAADLCAAGSLQGPQQDAPPCLAVRVARGLRAVREHRLDAGAAEIEPAAQQLAARGATGAEAADGLAALGELRARQNRPEEAQALLQRASALRVALWGTASPRLARTRYELALNLWTARRHALAEAELAAAMQAFVGALGPEHPTTALVELQLGRLRAWVHGRGQEEIAHAARVLAEAGSKVDPAKAFEARLVQLEALLASGRIGEARRLADAIQPMPGWTDDLAHVHDMARAWLQQVTGRFDAARATLDGAHARLSAKLDDAHPAVASVGLRLANLALSQDRFDEAQLRFQQVLQSQGSREAVFGSVKHQAEIGLARVSMARDDASKAWPAISASHEHALRTPRDELYATTLNDLDTRMGQVLVGLGRPAEARPHFERVIGALERGYVHNPTLAVVRAHFAACLLKLGDRAAAAAQLARAEDALAAEPLAGPQYRDTVRRVRGQLQAAAG